VAAFVGAALSISSFAIAHKLQRSGSNPILRHVGGTFDDVRHGGADASVDSANSDPLGFDAAEPTAKDAERAAASLAPPIASAELENALGQAKVQHENHDSEPRRTIGSDATLPRNGSWDRARKLKGASKMGKLAENKAGESRFEGLVNSGGP
jgi:hypothetical protein